MMDRHISDRFHALRLSVRCRFDVHALFFSEDAVALENELHKHFASRAVNKQNLRREFFFATPADVRDVLRAVASSAGVGAHFGPRPSNHGDLRGLATLQDAPTSGLVA